MKPSVICEKKEKIHEVFDYAKDAMTQAAADLRINGQYERLGAECGFGTPLGLEEALT